MKITVDSGEFADVMTAYEFEGELRRCFRPDFDPKGRLKRAYIKPSCEKSAEVGGVFLEYEYEAHRFTLGEVAEMAGAERVLVGKLGKDHVLCLVK